MAGQPSRPAPPPRVKETHEDESTLAGRWGERDPSATGACAAIIGPRVCPPSARTSNADGAVKLRYKGEMLLFLSYQGSCCVRLGGRGVDAGGDRAFCSPRAQKKRYPLVTHG